MHYASAWTRRAFGRGTRREHGLQVVRSVQHSHTTSKSVRGRRGCAQQGSIRSAAIHRLHTANVDSCRACSSHHATLLPVRVRSRTDSAPHTFWSSLAPGIPAEAPQC